MMVVPMRNHENEIIGVLQLINALDPKTGEVISFSRQSQEMTLSLASQAAHYSSCRYFYETITAKDRPYKKGKSVPEALKIMKDMVKDNFIDAILFELFVKEKIYQNM